MYEIRNQARIVDHKYLKYISAYDGGKFWWKCAYAVTLALNLINMSCLHLEFTNHRPVENSVLSCPTAFASLLRIILGIVHLLLWTISTTEYVIHQLPLALMQKRGIIDRRKNEFTETLSVEKTFYSSVELAKGFFSEPSGCYHLLMNLISLFGLRLNSLYSLHLLDFLYRDEVLHGVTSSITLNWNSLSKTVLLGVIIIYNYSVISFVYFRKSFDFEKGLHCDTLLSCFLTVLSHGVRAGGGVGDLLKVHNDAEESYTARLLLELSFFLIVVVFLLNVIFGIIFDTFGQLREERKAINDDLTGKCFICSIEAQEFQRHARGFDHHVKNDHNIWHYLFFFIHLKNKDVTEYNSHESFVADKLEALELDFFPINMALAIKRRDINDAQERLKRIEERLDELVKSSRAMKRRNRTMSNLNAELVIAAKDMLEELDEDDGLEDETM